MFFDKIKTLEQKHPVNTGMGKMVRRAAARTLLKSLDVQGNEISANERRILQIESRIDFEEAKHKFDLRCLMEFGVVSEELSEFKHILLEVAEHGGLDIKASADLAHARNVNY